MHMQCKRVGDSVMYATYAHAWTHPVVCIDDLRYALMPQIHQLIRSAAPLLRRFLHVLLQLMLT